MKFSYTYEKNVKRLKTPADFPQSDFFVVAIAGSRYETVPAYDYKDRDTTECVPTLDHYAVIGESTLQQMIEQLHGEGKKFVFYFVPTIGSFELKVNVKVNV